MIYPPLSFLYRHIKIYWFSADIPHPIMRKLIPLIGLAVHCLTAVTPASSQTAPNTPPRKITEQKADLIDLINRGISSGISKITIPPGRYRVSTKAGFYLRLKDLRDITIIADGVEMICTQAVQAIDLTNCENVTIQGLTIDYDPLPYTQARIVAVTDDNNETDVVAIPGYPALPSGPIYAEVFVPTTNKPRSRFVPNGLTSTIDGPNKATLRNGRKERSAEPIGKIGDIVVIDKVNQESGPGPHAISTSTSDRVTFSNVTLYAGYQIGFLDSYSTEVKYIGCRVDRRPPAEDIISRGYPRLKSMNGRGFQSNNARNGPLYERCISLYTAGESILIGGLAHYVVSNSGATLRVLSYREDLLKAGDTIQFLGADGLRTENRKILEIGAKSDPSESDLVLFSTDKYIVPQISKAPWIKAYTLKLDASVKVAIGTLVSFAETNGKGFIIKDCSVGFTRANGISVNAANGQIIGNRIMGTHLSGISVKTSYNWLDTCVSDDLKITGNTITEGLGMGIAIVSLGVDGSVAPAGTYRNITVRDNTITGGADPGLLITSVKGLISANNKIQTKPDLTLTNWDKMGWGTGNIKTVMTINTN